MYVCVYMYVITLEEDENNFNSGVHRNKTFNHTSIDNSMEKHTITSDKLSLVENIAGNYYFFCYYKFNNNCINVYI